MNTLYVKLEILQKCVTDQDYWLESHLSCHHQRGCFSSSQTAIMKRGPSPRMRSSKMDWLTINSCMTGTWMNGWLVDWCREWLEKDHGLTACHCYKAQVVPDAQVPREALWELHHWITGGNASNQYMFALMNFLKLCCAFLGLNVGNSKWILNMEEEKEEEVE